MSHRVLWLQTQRSFEVADGETVLAAAQRSLDKTEREQLHAYLERVLRALRDKD